jgi:hypothetical protein
MKMIKQIVFNADSHLAALSARSFTAHICLPAGDPVEGEPLVTLARNQGLPAVRDIYARLVGEPGPGGGTAYYVRLLVRFERKIRREGKLKGMLAVNVYVKGATDYFPFPPGG